MNQNAIIGEFETLCGKCHFIPNQYGFDMWSAQSLALLLRNCTNGHGYFNKTLCSLTFQCGGETLIGRRYQLLGLPTRSWCFKCSWTSPLNP